MGNRRGTADGAKYLPDSSPNNSADYLQSERAIFRRWNAPESLCDISPPAREILRIFERTLSGTESETLLVWPQPPDDIALFHAMAALNRLADCDSTELATLFFPWSQGTIVTQRRLLVDRDYVCESTLPALNRVWSENTSHTAFSYLMALHSLKHVLTSGKKDKRFRNAIKNNPGLMHPTLYEIMPQHRIQDSSGLWDYKDQFLRRLRPHTWIAERREYLEAAADPSQTPFFLYGVHSSATRTQLFRTAGLDPSCNGRRPDIVLVDLTRRARGRLGRDWQQSLNRFLGVVHDLYASNCPPMLAVTDDTFVLQNLRWDIVKEYDLRRSANASHKGPVFATVVPHPKPDPFDPETIESGSLSRVTAEVYGADILSVAELGLKVRRALQDTGESEIAEAVATAIYALESIAGLPGPPRQFQDFLADNYDGYERQRLGAQFDHLTPSGQIKSTLQLGLAGVNHDQLSAFLDAFDKLCNRASTDNPGRKLFDKCVEGLAREDARALVVFPSEALRGFAEWRIENDDTLSYARSMLGRKLLLVDRREAMEELDIDQRGQRLFEQLVFIQPRADDFLQVLTRSWIPEKVLVLANLAWAERTLRRIRILIDIDGIDPLRDKLLAVREELERTLSGRKIDVPDLDIPPPLPRLGTLDLTAGSVSGSGLTRIVTTSGNLRVKVFDGSEVAVYDPEALQIFSRKLAKDLKPGDQICVFSPDFVSMVRDKLNLTANASEVLPLYHRTVADAVVKLPGEDMTSKARALRERMLDIEPTLELPGIHAIRQWIDVESLVHAPRNEVRPQAPRDRRHYLCLMRALGISEDLASHYWDLGIFWTRSKRIRSGFAFHQVFMGILIDPHGTVTRLPESRRHDVWRIYETAERHVATVISNQRERN